MARYPISSASSIASPAARLGRPRHCARRQPSRSSDGRRSASSALGIIIFRPGAAASSIEFNDNGSGFLFAAIINALYYDSAGLSGERHIAAPLRLPAFKRHIADLVEREANAFFGESPGDLFLVLDDADSLKHGKFRRELELLGDLLRQRGWRAALASPTEIRFDGRRALFNDQAVSFILNRSTDFFWQGQDFSALRSAYHAGLEADGGPDTFQAQTGEWPRIDCRVCDWRR